MAIPAEALLSALQLLLRASHLARADDVPPLVAQAAALIGARRGLIYVIDYNHVTLVPFSAQDKRNGAQPLSVEATLAGRAFRDVTQHVGSTSDRLTLWTPLVDGTERLGVLELEFDPAFAIDDDARTVCRDLAAAVAEFTVTRTIYGDAYEQVRRLAPLTIPAEVQWSLLPPLTFVSSRVAIAGGLAPATEVAGDSFDYSVNGDITHVGIVDAMGHGLEATLLATVAIGAMRNGRRSGLSLIDIVTVMDAAIAAQFGPDKFVTAIVGELDTITGTWTWITCGHPPALVVRGGRVVKTLDQHVNAPLGLNMLRGHPDHLRRRV